MREPASFSRQRGMAVLAVSVIMLFLITVVTFYANKGAVLEQKMSANQLQYQQAYEAAQGGVDYSLAWLASASGANAATAVAGITSSVSASPYNQQNAASSIPPMGNYNVSLVLRNNSGKVNVVEIEATSADTTAGSTGATVKVKQAINVSQFINAPLTPLVINGCVSGVQNANVNGPASGVAITSFNTNPTCTNSTGSLTLNNGAFPASAVAGSTYTGTAWDYAFPITKAAMLALANAQTGGATGGPIYYYTAPPNNFGTNLGTSTSPVILIFDGACPKINGGTTIYGMVYCASGGTLNGWGSATIIGSLITDTPITQINGGPTFSVPANASLFWFNLNPSNIPRIVSKVTGAWRDF